MNSLKILRGVFTKSDSLFKSSEFLSRRSFHKFNFLAARVSFKLSDIGEGIREVIVKEWYVKEGDKVAQFDNICEVQSDKASVTITSRYDGVISKLHYNIDDLALVGKPLVDIETDQAEGVDVEEKHTVVDEQQRELNNVKKEKELVQVQEVGNEEKGDSKVDILCIPSVRRLAKEHKLDLSKIKGTGKNGRIIKEDILKFIDSVGTQESDKTFDLKTDVSQLKDEIKPISGFRKAMVKTMTESMKIPHFVYSDEIKVTKLSELRRTINSTSDLNVKLSFMPFFVKAVSNSLREFPVVNASPDENCNNIIYHKNHNIGIAMDTTVGLAVPVIKEVEHKNILEISMELSRLMKSGKSGTFVPNDLSGGTFTVSNIGSIGGTYTKPVILPPQVAIVAIGTSQILPRFDEARNIIAEEIINASVSADHRIVDGATIARFLNLVKKQIESPYLLLLNV